MTVGAAEAVAFVLALVQGAPWGDAAGGAHAAKATVAKRRQVERFMRRTLAALGAGAQDLFESGGSQRWHVTEISPSLDEQRIVALQLFVLGFCAAHALAAADWAQLQVVHAAGSGAHIDASTIEPCFERMQYCVAMSHFRP